jgi:hypothetical protein
LIGVALSITLFNPQLWLTSCLGVPNWALWLFFISLPVVWQPILGIKTIGNAIYKSYQRWKAPPPNQLLAEYISEYDSDTTDAAESGVTSSSIATHIKDGVFSMGTVYSQVVGSILFMNYAFYIIAAASLLPLNCFNIITEETYPLVPVFECGTSEWWSYLPVFIVVALCYHIVYPVVLFVQIYRTRGRISASSVVAPIMAPFRQTVYYWPSLRLLRDQALAIIYIMVPQPVAQMLLLILLCGSALVLHVIVKPYRMPLLNLLEGALLLLMLLFYCAVLGLSRFPSQTTDISIMVVALVTFSIALLVTLYVIKPHITSYLQERWNRLVNQSPRFSFSPMKALIDGMYARAVAATLESTSGFLLTVCIAPCE